MLLSQLNLHLETVETAFGFKKRFVKMCAAAIGREKEIGKKQLFCDGLAVAKPLDRRLRQVRGQHLVTQCLVTRTSDD